MSQKRKIIFVGGIHGVGKTSICRAIESKIDIELRSASVLLRWKELPRGGTQKRVWDINETQRLLIEEIDKQLDRSRYYLLDGHLCLLDHQGQSKRIPFSTMTAISPIAICVVTENPLKIAERLSLRDNKFYSTTDLDEMQNEEMQYGIEIAEKLSIPFVSTKSGDIEPLINLIRTKGYFNENPS